MKKIMRHYTLPTKMLTQMGWVLKKGDLDWLGRSFVF
jgi:hypothetical protein